MRTFARGRDCPDADRIRNQTARIWAVPNEPEERMDVAIRYPLGMEGELGLSQANVRCELTAHAPALLENAVSPDSLNAASTPSPMPKARISRPSPARCFAQNAMRSLS